MNRICFLWLVIAVCINYVFVNAQTDCGTVKDYDGNVYQTVKLGEQCWMAQNLRVTHYADGTPLKFAPSDASAPCYFIPGNGADNVTRMGLLYTWYTALNSTTPTENVPSGVQGVCPDGWHLPSNFEWMGLEDYLGYKDEYRCGTDVNDVAKSLASKEEWQAESMDYLSDCAIVADLSKNNASGMNVLPSGSCWEGVYTIGYNAGFWTASDGSDITSPIHYFAGSHTAVEINCTPKEAAYSVRCLKN